MIELLIACLVLGVAAGLLAGTLGLGGGVVIVPALLALFLWRGFDPTVLVQMAVATSLATILVTSISAIRGHHQLGNIRWSVARPLMAGIMLGAWAGAQVADALPGQLLAQLFGAFAIIIALQMLRPTTTGSQQSPSERLPHVGIMAGLGLIIGAFSAMFGIGGGSMTVPLLSAFRFAMRQAVAISAACGLPIALSGGLGFVVAGWNNPALPEGSLGYVYLPAAAAIVLTSYPMARVGARVAHRLPAMALRRVFALVLMLIGLRLVLG